MTDNLSDKKRTLLIGKSDNSTDSIWRFGLGRYPSCFVKKSYWVKESFSFTLKCSTLGIRHQKLGRAFPSGILY